MSSLSSFVSARVIEAEGQLLVQLPQHEGVSLVATTNEDSKKSGLPDAFTMIRNGNIDDLVTAIHDTPACLVSRNQEHLTPLGFAIVKNQTDMVDVLLEGGAACSIFVQGADTHFSPSPVSHLPKRKRKLKLT